MALCQAHAHHPFDPNIATIAVEALQSLRTETGTHGDSHLGDYARDKILEITELGLTHDPENPWLHSRRVLAVAFDPRSSGAKIADRLAPSIAVLESLPPSLAQLSVGLAHLDLRLGNPERALERALAAIEVGDRIIEERGRGRRFDHVQAGNIDFAAYCAMQAGRPELALELARRMPALDDAYARTEDPKPYLPTTLQVKALGAMDDEILAEPFLEADRDLPLTHLARGFALLRRGEFEAAKSEFRASYRRPSVMGCPAAHGGRDTRQILEIHESVLGAEVWFHRTNQRGRVEEPIESLREAVEIERTLLAEAPWACFLRPRHHLAAMLAHTGELDAALALHDEILAQMPGDPWALRGRFECLEALGRTAEAEEARARLATAWGGHPERIPRITAVPPPAAK